MDENFIDKLKKVTDSASEKFCEIKSAKMNDQLCTYSYEHLQGKTKGDIITRKGVHVVHDDMISQFDTLDVFLAHIEGAFKDANNKTSLEELEAEELLSLYKVTGFKLSGKEENKSIILVGYKEVQHGTINFETPKIKLEGSAYLYIEELTERLFSTIEEVESYMDGKSAPQPEQIVMSFEHEDAMDLQGAAVDFDNEDSE